jgi:hypothetical protein
MYKSLAVLLFVFYSVNANFWSPCSNLPNAVVPRLITSPSCPPTADRCTATRGQPLEARVFFTPVSAHARLDVRVTAFILGVGVNLPPDNDNA